MGGRRRAKRDMRVPLEQVATVGSGHPCKPWQKRNLGDGRRIQMCHLVKYCLKMQKVDLCPEALRKRKSKRHIERTVKAHVPL